MHILGVVAGLGGLLAVLGCSRLPPFDAECSTCKDTCPDPWTCKAGICIDHRDPLACNPLTPQCKEFCETALQSCPNIYVTETNCIGVCTSLAEGDPSAPMRVPNSIACRRWAAMEAASASGQEHADLCQAAGPGGNGVCGSNCESYCKLAKTVCGEGLDYPMEAAMDPNCEEACQVFPDSGRFDINLDHDGDTLQCRLVHLSSATRVPEAHCAHADYTASVWCTDYAPLCTYYCDAIENACEFDDAVYDNRAQCEAVCQLLEPSPELDDGQGPVECRLDAAGRALETPAWCPAAGPTGDGRCGSDVEADEAEGRQAEFAACRPYCRLLRAGCPERFADTWSGGYDACVEQCDESDEQFGAAEYQEYSVARAEVSGNTLGCRTVFAIRALEEPANESHCAAAFGGPPCN